MEPLIKVTSVPFQSIRFAQNARLIPADNMALERHKALVRHRAFLSRSRAASSFLDYDFLNQVNAAFSKETKAGKTPVSITGPGAGSVAGRKITLAGSENQAFHPRPVSDSNGASSPAQAMQTNRSIPPLSRFRRKRPLLTQSSAVLLNCVWPKVSFPMCRPLS